MNLPGMNLPVDDSPIARFCALEYRVAEIDAPPALENVIVLFLRYENGALTVFSHQDWQKIVQREDREYVRDLLQDFKERADRTPDALLQQVASLSVGPLVTYAAGSKSDLKASIGLFEICRNMTDRF